MASEFVSLDGRLWLTIWTLVRHPGRLARDYFDGRGARYMRPLNLFLLLNLVFFVVQPHTGMLQWHLRGYLSGTRDAPALVEQARLDRAREVQRDAVRRGAASAPLRLESMEVFEASFESTIQNLKKSMLLVAIPLFALAMTLIYGFRRRIAEHLIFATHFYAFVVFALTLFIPLLFVSMRGWLLLVRAPRAATNALNTEPALMGALFLLFGAYLYVGLRRMYGDGWAVATARAAALSGVFQLTLLIFGLSMFRVTLWTM